MDRYNLLEIREIVMKLFIVALLILSSGCIMSGSGGHTVLRPDWLHPGWTKVNIDGRTKQIISPDWLFPDRYRIQDPKTGHTEAILRSDWLFPDRYNKK